MSDSLDTATRILDRLEGLGVHVERIGEDRLRFRPASRIPVGLVKEIKSSKAELIRLLDGQLPGRIDEDGDFVLTISALPSLRTYLAVQGWAVTRRGGALICRPPSQPRPQ